MPRPSAKNYLAGVLKKYGLFPWVIDLGAGEDPNFYEDLFEDVFFDKLDMVQNRAKTIKWVIDIHDMTEIPRGGYGLAICMETLEHVKYPVLAIKNMIRILKPGGILVVTTVACWGIHAHPKDYWRFLPDGMELLLQDAGFEVLEVKLEGGSTITPCGIFASARKPA